MPTLWWDNNNVSPALAGTERSDSRRFIGAILAGFVLVAGACGGGDSNNVSAEANSNGVGTRRAAPTTVATTESAPTTSPEAEIANNVNIVNQGEFEYSNYNISIDNIAVINNPAPSETDEPATQVVEVELAAITEDGETFTEEQVEALFLEDGEGNRISPSVIEGSDTLRLKFEVDNAVNPEELALGVSLDEAVPGYFDLDNGARADPEDVDVEGTFSGKYSPVVSSGACEGALADVVAGNMFLTVELSDDIELPSSVSQRAADGTRYLVSEIKVDYLDPCPTVVEWLDPTGNEFQLVVNGIGRGVLSEEELPSSIHKAEGYFFLGIWSVPDDVSTVSLDIGLYEPQVGGEISLPAPQ